MYILELDLLRLRLEIFLVVKPVVNSDIYYFRYIDIIYSQLKAIRGNLTCDCVYL